MGPGPFHDRQRIQELWRFPLDEAQKQYDLAVAESQAAGTDFRSQQLPPPDGRCKFA